MKWEICEEHAGMLIREFLTDIAQFSKRLMIKAKSAEGKILVNGNKATVRYVLKIGDILQVVLPEEVIGARMIKEKLPLSIIYEDDALLVVDKPPDMATIPSRHHPTGTLANGILYYYADKNLPYTVHVVTRLDRETSGLVLIAKNQYSHSLLDRLLRNNGLKRRYLALVHGDMEKMAGTINMPIGRKDDSIIERIVTEKGQRAITHFQVERIFQDKTLVGVMLETGRTHQIRVHFSAIGHSLLGDDLYGGERIAIGRQALHCASLTLTHPFTGEKLVFNAPLPVDMAQICNQ